MRRPFCSAHRLRERGISRRYSSDHEAPIVPCTASWKPQSYTLKLGRSVQPVFNKTGRSLFCPTLAFSPQGIAGFSRRAAGKAVNCLPHIVYTVEKVLCRSALVSEPRGPGFFEVFLLVDLFEVLRERKQSQPIPVALGKDLLINHRSAVPSFLDR